MQLDHREVKVHPVQPVLQELPDHKASKGVLVLQVQLAPQGHRVAQELRVRLDHREKPGPKEFKVLLEQPVQRAQRVPPEPQVPKEFRVHPASRVQPVQRAHKVSRGHQVLQEQLVQLEQEQA